MRVIVTRPAHQAEAWCADLRRNGLQAEALPLIAIESVVDPVALRAAWAGLPAVELTVFVSANAVRQFVAAQSTDARWPAGRRAAATGPGTAAALLEAGVEPALLSQPATDAEQFDSETLWSQLQHEAWAGRRVLIVRGEEGRNWLSEQFVAQGAQVDFVVAYRRRLPQIDAEGRALLQAARLHPRGPPVAL